MRPRRSRWCVEDTGFGIGRSDLEKIFDPFFTTKPPGKGTGLGLSTSLSIIKSHNGFVRVRSELGAGARFLIYLPAAMGEARATEALDQPTALPRGAGETVMVVDDERSIRHTTRVTLESFGYRVLLASDGSEALQTIERESGDIDLVILDMMMPVLDGASTLAALKAKTPSIPVIATSGVASSEKARQAMDARAQRFLPKPYTAETLLRTVRETLSQERP